MAKKHYYHLSKVLQKLLYQHRLNPSQLAHELNLPVPTVHRIVSGKSTRPHPASLKPIADYFSLNLDQLLGEEPIPEWGSTNPRLPSHQHVKSVPIIDWDKATHFSLTTETSENEILTTGQLSEHAFALCMNDYSMEPLFPKHTILIFDPHQTPVDRSYVLVKLAGKPLPIFRQLLMDVDHRFLKPLNPDLQTYPMRLLNTEDQVIASLFESRIQHNPNGNNLMEAIQ